MSARKRGAAREGESAPRLAWQTLRAPALRRCRDRGRKRRRRARCGHSALPPERSMPAVVIHLLALLHGQAQVLVRAPAVPIGVVGVVHLLLLREEGVSVLEGEELVQRREEREKIACELPPPLEVGQAEDAFGLRRDHVVHLAHDVREGDGVVVQALHPLDLLLVEVLHLVVPDAAVTVEIEHMEPVLHRPICLPILIAQQEPDEVLVPHLPRHCGYELRRRLAKYAIYGPARQCVPVVLQQVVLVQQEVVVRVQLPESAVDDIEVLVAEVIPDHFDVVVVRQLLPGLDHRGPVPSQRLKMDSAHIFAVIDEEDSRDDSVRIAVLEFLSLSQEVKTGVCKEDRQEKNAEVFPLDPIVVLLLHNVEKTED
mmetsp:Transcript_34514/g.96335  ORF Transcript_34514/g.96335 Transcript_34514/m.96335 type:complete len:370 (-) Transcript_34514:308-1417(-)